MSDDWLISGEIVFDSSPDIAEATAYVRLEDVSLMDAPSKLVAEQVLRDIELSDGGPIAFTLRAPRPSEKARLNLSAHISITGTSDIQKGDYITMQSYPITSQVNTEPIRVIVRRV